MTLALEVGKSSEDLFTPPDFEEEIAPEQPIEVAPTVEKESLGAGLKRVSSAWIKEACPECGVMVAKSQMGNHFKNKHGGNAPPAVEKKPRLPKDDSEKVSTRRQRADDILTSAVSAVGMLLINSGASVPAGRALALEASLLGPEFDKAAAGTIIDRVALQPLMKGKSKWEGVANLAAFPVICFMLDKQPAMMPVLYPALRSSMKGILPGLVKAKKKQLQDQVELAKAAEELMQLDMELQGMVADTGPDPIDLLIASLFPQVEMEPEGDYIAMDNQ